VAVGCLCVDVVYIERVPDIPATADYRLCAMDTALQTSPTAQREPREKDSKRPIIIIIIFIIIFTTPSSIDPRD